MPQEEGTSLNNVTHDNLIADLLHGKPKKRKSAAEQLRRTADQQAINSLSQVLYDEYLPVRRIALEALLKAADTRAVDSFALLLQGTEEEWHASKNVWQHVCKYYQDATLPTVTSHDFWSVAASPQKTWLEFLAVTVERLGALFSSGHPIVRCRVLYVLGRMSSKRATSIIVTALQDPDATIRAYAAHMLGPVEAKINNPEAVEPLIVVLRTDDEPHVRANAALALGLLLDNRAVDPLITALLSDEVDMVRGEAAGALRNLSGEQIIPALRKALDDPSALVRMWATNALSQQARYARETTAQVVPKLLELLHDPDANVRREAIVALGMIGDERALQSLEQLVVRDEPREVSWSGESVIEAATEAVQHIRKRLQGDM